MITICGRPARHLAASMTNQSFQPLHILDAPFHLPTSLPLVLDSLGLPSTRSALTSNWYWESGNDLQIEIPYGSIPSFLPSRASQWTQEERRGSHSHPSRLLQHAAPTAHIRPPPLRFSEETRSRRAEQRKTVKTRHPTIRRPRVFWPSSRTSCRSSTERGIAWAG